jgi:hypothetical protein
MLKTEENIRLEEVIVPQNFAGKSLGELQTRSREYILLATREPQGTWLSIQIRSKQ